MTLLFKINATLFTSVKMCLDTKLSFSMISSPRIFLISLMFFSFGLKELKEDSSTRTEEPGNEDNGSYE